MISLSRKRNVRRKKDLHPKYLFLLLSMICVFSLCISYYNGGTTLFFKDQLMGMITPIQKGIDSFGVYFDNKAKNFQKIEDLEKENQELRDELSKLREDVTIYQNKLADYESISEIYDLDQTYTELDKVAAHVFAKDTSSWFSIFYINKGKKDGLYVGANVLSGEGLCGVVVEVYDDYAKIRAIIDDNSYISAKILPSNTLCTVEGSISEYTNRRLKVVNIDIDTEVNIGDKVVTSQISDKYHQGLLIGYIIEVINDENNLTKTAYISTAADFTNIDNVLVITTKKNTIEDKN